METRLKEELNDLCRAVHKDSFVQGWNVRGDAGEASAEAPKIPPFKVPKWTPSADPKK